MKLTKAQRLFIKAGRMETMINGLAYKIQTSPLSAAITVPKGALKRMRRERKRLIREALEAARSENTEHYMNGINEVLRLIGR